MFDLIRSVLVVLLSILTGCPDPDPAVLLAFGLPGVEGVPLLLPGRARERAEAEKRGEANQEDPFHRLFSVVVPDIL